MNNIPQSKIIFDRTVELLSQRLEESEDTIFSGTDLTSLKNKYEEFLESVYGELYFQESSDYEKQKVILKYLHNEPLSDIFTNTYDHLVQENGELSFREEYLLENSLKYNVHYKGSKLLDNLIEEGFGIGVVAGYLGSFVGGLIPIVAFSSIAVLGTALFLPARMAKSWDDGVSKLLGLVGEAAFGTQSVLHAFARDTALSSSNRIIVNFDNIDGNPEVKKLFFKLSRSKNKKESVEGLGTIVASCLENNDILEGMNIQPNQKNYLFGKYTPRNNTVFTVFIQSIFKNSGTPKEQYYQELLGYRKCLSDKLTDIYKFLMIGNIAQNKDYKKIVRVMKKGFHNNPDQLLHFIDNGEDDEKTRENIIILIKYRILLEDLAKELKKGIFDVDREASIYLSQKLKVVDNEIEEYFKRNDRQLTVAHENQKDFQRKDFKYNKPDEKKINTRSLFNTTSNIK